MIGTRTARGIAVLAGLLVAAIVFGGVAYADDNDGNDGEPGAGGFARAHCDWGWLGGGTNNQCQSSYGGAAESGSGY
ncbi:MAG: hypothetical protein J2P19_30570 [Pseudonocardia sp.]|nr:hypothetical protein [Pseudonocardia sp.]